MKTNRPVIIYISAASDLMAEREALARMIATLPVTLAWRVVQTPIGQEELTLELVSVADLHFLVMGGDIRAPVGLELYTARQTGRSSVAFLKRGVARTAAGQIFVKEARVAWREFTKAPDLSRAVQQMLVEHLVRHASRYSLTLAEIEQLEALQAAGSVTDAATSGEEAGRSAVILSRERFEPSDGVIVNEG